MTTQLGRGFVVLAVLLAAVSQAHAETTFLVAADSSSGSSPIIGIALGSWTRTVGFEVELAANRGRATAARPSVESISGDLLLRTPLTIKGGRIYGVAGVGLYNASAGDTGSGEVSAKVIGVGTEYRLGGSLRLRTEYRLFVGGALDAPRPHPRSTAASRLAVAVSVPF